YLNSIKLADDINDLPLQQINRITSLFIKMGNYADAIRLNQPLLAKFELLFEKDVTQTNELIRNVLFALMMTSSLDQAVEVAERIFSMTIQKLGKYHHHTANAAALLSDVLSQSGYYKRSEE